MQSIKAILHFPATLTGRPITSYLIRDYNLTFNILQASVKPGMRGALTIELSGAEEDLENGLRFLRDEGIEVTLLSRSIVWDAEHCVHCGACIASCPSGALALGEDARLIFDEARCVVCEQCVKTCPLNVMAVNYTGQGS